MRHIRRYLYCSLFRRNRDDRYICNRSRDSRTVLRLHKVWLHSSRLYFDTKVRRSRERTDNGIDSPCPHRFHRSSKDIQHSRQYWCHSLYLGNRSDSGIRNYRFYRHTNHRSGRDSKSIRQSAVHSRLRCILLDTYICSRPLFLRRSLHYDTVDLYKFALMFRSVSHANSWDTRTCNLIHYPTKSRNNYRIRTSKTSFLKY